MLNGSTPPGRLLGSTPPRMVQVIGISGRNLGSCRWFRFNGSGDGSGDGSAPPVIRVPVSGLRLTARVRRVSSGILLSGVCTLQRGNCTAGVCWGGGHASGTLLRDDNTVKSQDRRRWHAADRPNCSTIDIERGARTDMRASPAVVTAHSRGPIPSLKLILILRAPRLATRHSPFANI